MQGAELGARMRGLRSSGDGLGMERKGGEEGIPSDVPWSICIRGKHTAREVWRGGLGCTTLCKLAPDPAPR